MLLIQLIQYTIKPLIERHGALFFNPSAIVAVNWMWRSNREFWEDKFSPITGKANVAYIFLTFSSGAIY